MNLTINKQDNYLKIHLLLMIINLNGKKTSMNKH